MPVVRYPEVLEPPQPLQVALPLRILGMVARPGDQQALDVGEEQHRLRTALAGLERDRLVELSWVAGQTYSELEDALDRVVFSPDGRLLATASADRTGRVWVLSDDG